MDITTNIKREGVSLSNWHEEASQPLHLNQPLLPSLVVSDFPNLEEQLDESTKSRKDMALNVAANFLAGGLGTGGADPLDGMQPIHVFTTWRWVLEKLLSFPSLHSETLQKLVSQIQILLNQCTDQKQLFNRFSEEGFIEMVKRYTETMKKLEKGDSHPFFGGWGNIGGGSGHALMYEVRRNEQGNFDMRLYTSTGFQLARNLLCGDKRRLNPVVCYENIPEEYLFASTGPTEPPVFFQQLFEMDWAISRHDKNEILDEAYILEAFDFLKHFHKDRFNDFGAETGQRGGTCLPSSTKTWAKYQFPSFEEYKKFKGYFDFVLYLGLYEELKDHLEEDRSRELLIDAAKKLVGKIDKLANHQKEGISEDFAIEATKRLQADISSLEKLSRDLAIKKKEEVLSVNVSHLNVQSQQEIRGKERYWITESQYADKRGVSPSSFPRYLTLQGSDYVSFLEQLKALYQDKIAEKKSSSKQAANLSLHHAIDQLPIPPTDNEQSPWHKCNPDYLLKSCQTLREIGVYYLQNSAYEDLPPRRFATLFTLYAIVHHLVCLIDEKKERSGKSSLRYYSFPFEGDKLNQIDSLTFHDTHKFNRIEEAKAYFKAKRAGVTLFQSEDYTEVVKDSIHKAPTNAELWKGLMNSHKKFEKAVTTEANKRFPDYTEEQIEQDFQKQRKALEKWYEDERTYKTLPKRPYHPKPPEAQKLKNLPLLTKQMLVLEEFDPKTGNSLLAKYFPEINEVRAFACFVGNAINKPWRYVTSLDRKAQRKSDHYTTQCVVTSNASEDSFNLDFFQYEWNQFINGKQYPKVINRRDFFKLDQTKRDQNTWKRETAEAQALDQKNLPSLLHQSARTLSEWKLTPHQLLLEWGKDFEFLKDPDMQGLFFRLFFRSPVDRERVHLGVGELIDNPDLLLNIQTFVQKGLSYFIKLKQKEGAGYNIHDVEGVKFLFEFTVLCQKYLHDQNKINLIKQINFIDELTSWIQDTTISRKARALLRLYRILHHFIQTPVSHLTQESLQQILLDWSVVHLYSDGSRPAQISPLLFSMADNFIAQIITHHKEMLDKNSLFFCSPILEEAGVGLFQLTWELVPDALSIYKGTTKTNESYHVDLRRGEIFAPTGKVSRVILSRAWEEDRNFKRIFSKHNPFEYTTAGAGAVTFRHPQEGFFRILLKQYYGTNLIQKQFGDEWYQYIPLDEIKEEKLGLSQGLVKDHAVWAQVKVNKIKVETVEVAHVSQTTSGPVTVFLKSVNGKTYTVDVDFNKSLQEQVSTLTKILQEFENITLVLNGKPIDVNQPLTAFNLARESTIHLTTNGKDPQTILNLKPSTSNSTLLPHALPVNFHPFKAVITSLQTGRPVWAIDEKGRIFEIAEEEGLIKAAQEDMSVHYLEAADSGLTHFEEAGYILTQVDSAGKTQRVDFPRYHSLNGNPLFFIRKEGRDHLSWNDNQQYDVKETPQGVFPSHTKYLYLTPTNKKNPGIILIPFNRRFCSPAIEEWGSIPYFDYQIKGGQIIPQSLEGRFYLSYLYYGDKKYQSAITEMTSIYPIDTVSPLGFLILDQIRKKHPPIDHPDAAMVPLWAALQFIKALDRQSHEPVSSYFTSTTEDIKALNNLIFWAYTSLQASNHISEGCRLPDSEKKILFQKLVDEAQSKMALFEDMNITYPHELIEHLTYWLINPSKTQTALKEVRQYPKDRHLERLQKFSFELPSKPSVDNETLQKRYEDDCRFATLWLEKDSGHIPFLVSRWPLESPGGAKENGKLLSQVLEIAHAADNMRLAMLWKLRNWRLHWRKQKEDIAFLDLMIQILLRPTNFPKAIPDSTSPTQKAEFLQNEIDYKQHSSGADFLESIDDHLKNYSKAISSSLKSQGPYPEPSLVSWYNQKEPSLSDFGHTKEPLLQEVKGNIDDYRTHKLTGWRTQFCAPFKTQDKSPPSSFRFSMKEGLLSKEDEAYKDSIQRDLDILAADFDEGVKQLDQQEEITVTHEGGLLEAIQKEKETTLKSLQKKEKEAQESLNRLPLPFKDYLHRIAQDVKGVKKSISLDKAREALLTFDKRAFKVLNPSITDADIEIISQLLIDIEDLKSWKLQLERMEDLVSQGQDITDPQDPTKRDLARRLLQELEASTHFNTLNAESQVVFRSFCGGTGLVPFKKQVDLITRMLATHKDDPSVFQDCISQLIMGGGKTSVIAALLLQLLSRLEGKIALFIVPSPLLKSVSSNLTTSLKKGFNQTLEIIDVRRSDLTPYRLTQIEKLLKTSQENPIPIITTPASNQIFKLEFLSQLRKLKAQIEELKNSLDEKQEAHKIPQLQKLIDERVKKIKQLAKIVETISESSHALLDEVDLILDALLEINFPDGTKVAIQPERNHLAHTIFSHCMRDDLRVTTLPGNPLIKDALRLDLKLQQTPLEGAQEKAAFQARYRESVVVLAHELATSFAPFQTLPKDLQPSLERFLTRKIPLWVQDFADKKHFQFNEDELRNKDPQWQQFGTLAEFKNDCHFLSLLNDRAKSPNKKEKQLAELISFATHLLNDVLSMTLLENAKRDYGPVPSNPHGKICPYDGVDSPVTDREFGYPWAEVCYYYQWACLSTPEDAVIIQLAKLATEAAHYYMKKNGELFNQTVEYLQFKELTGCSLQDFQDTDSHLCREALIRARETLQKDPKKRLDLQKELAASQVKMNSLYLSGNGLSLCRNLSSRRGMSGTPWNVEGYRQSLAENFIPDQGTEGKVLATLARQVTQNKLHKVDLIPDMENLLGQVFQSSPTPTNIRGLIDAGGLLKIWPNNAVIVQQILSFLEKEQKTGSVNKDIDTVLFFHKEKGETQANTLYMWKMGAEHPEKVGATTQEALKAKGIDPQKCFTLYDERHTTGTDILQDPTAVNLFTFDPKMLLRTLPQGAMRLRQLLSSQSIEIVIDKTTLADIYNQGQTIDDLLLQAAKNQSIRKTSNMPRYYTMQIEDPFQTYAVQPLLNLFTKDKFNDDAFLDLMQKAEPYFVHTLQDNLFEQFGRLKKEEDSKAVLTNRLDKLAQNFPFPSEALDKEMEALREHIQKAPLPPYMKTACANIGMQTEVEAETEVETNVEQEKQTEAELDQDIDRELQLYENLERSDYRKDKPISYEDFQTLIQQLSSTKPALTSIADQLGKFKYGLKDERKHYETIFSEPIYGTENYFNTCTYILPVFHHLQRPPTQILAVKADAGMKWLLLSEHEASSVKQHLKDHPEHQNIWLIQPDGTPLAPTSQPFPIDDQTNEDIFRGLLEINVFNGNADWLGYYEHYLAPWLIDNSELKLNFLKLRTARHPHQRQILSYLPSILRLSAEHQIDMKSSHMIFSARAGKEIWAPGDDYTPTSLVDVKLLKSMKQIEQLLSRFIPDLGIDMAKTDEPTKEALQILRTKHRGATEEEFAQTVDNHSKTQIKYLPNEKVQHLSCEQLKWIDLSQVPYLKKPEQIAKTTEHFTQYFLSEEQVKHLVPSQANLIPFVNPDYYKHLTHLEHIQKVPPIHLDKIEPNYGCHLTSLQIKEGITTLDLVQRYKPHFLPAQWQHVNGELIQGIPPDEVTQTHIQEIKDVNTIQSLHTIAQDESRATKWIGWLTSNQLNHVTDEQLPYIQSPSLVRSFSFWKALHFLTPEQLKHRTFLQKTVHALALYTFGILAKIALWTRVSHLLHITQKCQIYSDLLDKSKIKNWIHSFFHRP